MAKTCKKCGAKCEVSYCQVQKSGELVGVDEQVQEVVILDADDCLCLTCNTALTFYRRVR